jgi:subtilisin family serine protease
MRRRLLLLLLTLMAASPATAAQYILQLNAGANISQITTQYGLTLVRTLSDDGRTFFLVFTLNPLTTQQISRIGHDPGVREIEANSEVHSTETPTATKTTANIAALIGSLQNRSTQTFYGSIVRASYPQQPQFSLIRAGDAQAHFGTGAGIVAVIDTGVDPHHPALANVLVPGYDFTRDLPGNASEWSDLSQSTVAILDQSTVAILDSKNFPMVLNQSTVAILDQSTVAILDATKLPSDFGHGTMVAGLIHLVAPTARIMPLKAFHADGSANLSDIVRAIYYAVDHNATVINMSFSSTVQSPAITAAMQYAWSHNVICIAAAGNEGARIKVYPAGDYGVIGVASTTPQDRRSSFTNYGVSSVKMAAPGEALITTYPGNNYAGVWGTSFSTALTSGAMSVFLQVFPHLRSELSDALEHGHSLDIDGLGDARLDVYAIAAYCSTAH